MQKTKALLTIKCRNMKNPKIQRSKLDQTLITSSWLLQENTNATIQQNGTVTTVTVWGRLFGPRKTEKTIEKVTENMIKRAAKEAAIDDYSIDLQLCKIAHAHEEFDQAPILTSDD